MPTVHAFVSAISDGADATLVRPSNWNADHLTTLPDSATEVDSGRTVISGTDRLTLAGTSRLTVQNTGNGFRGTYAMGSPTIYDNNYVLQYKHAQLNGNGRATIVGSGELFIFDLAPVGRLVLAGSGGNV